MGVLGIPPCGCIWDQLVQNDLIDFNSRTTQKRCFVFVIWFLWTSRTGFSRALNCDPCVFFSHQTDGEIHAAFISKYLQTLCRKVPSVFLFGESYGGARAGRAAQLLQQNFTPLCVEWSLTRLV